MSFSMLFSIDFPLLWDNIPRLYHPMLRQFSRWSTASDWPCVTQIRALAKVCSGARSTMQLLGCIFKQVFSACPQRVLLFS